MSDAINPDHYKRLPAEAIEIIESAIEGAPTSQEAYLQGQALKYLLRANHKNGREDIHKAKWYLDRMVASFTVPSDLLDHPSSPTEPPDGWRWLEVGEALRRGDTTNTIDEIPEDWIGIKCAVKHNIFRRNRYEVGEKVVYIQDESVWDYISEINDGPNYPKSAHVASGSTSLRVCVTRLAPYIEETT